MAEFSKQWCDKNDPQMSFDFDINEVANSLEPNHYTPIICEGFGFIAIGKTDDQDEKCILAMPVDDAPYGTVKWVDCEQIIK